MNASGTISRKTLQPSLVDPQIGIGGNGKRSGSPDRSAVIAARRWEGRASWAAGMGMDTGPGIGTGTETSEPTTYSNLNTRFGQRRASQPLLSFADYDQTGQPAPDGNNNLPPLSPSQSPFAFHKHDFKFGGPSSASYPVSPNQTHSQTHSPSCSPTSYGGPRGEAAGPTDAQAEADEAEQQRIAFIQMTYGGIRRPSHISLSSQSHPFSSASAKGSKQDSPGIYDSNGVEVLMGNEGFRRGSLGFPTYGGLGATDAPLGSVTGEEKPDCRRGSIPVAIPNSSVDDAERKDRHPRSKGAMSSTMVSMEESDEDQEEEHLSDERQPAPYRVPLNRPLPPLLPLSDPGPRLLQSTLTLHRASHMLQAKNLSSEPLPHPLPPSLHPPAPVDVSDFDIDFILSGYADAVAVVPSVSASYTAGMDAPSKGCKSSKYQMQLGLVGAEEDSFATFVGAHDENYDATRGEWTFRALRNQEKQTPLGLAAKTKALLSGHSGECLQWGSPAVGIYVIRQSGEVQSVSSGRVWKVRKRGGRGFELQDVTTTEDAAGGSRDGEAKIIILAAKSVHNDFGGVKIGVERSTQPPPPSLQPPPQPSTLFDTDDRDLASSPKMSAFLNVVRPFVGGDSTRRGVTTVEQLESKSPHDTSPITDDGFPGPYGAAFDHQPLIERRKSRSQDASQNTKRKDKESIGDKIKRSFRSGIKSSEKQQRKEYERERNQSQSWSGVTIQHPLREKSSGSHQETWLGGAANQVHHPQMTWNDHSHQSSGGLSSGKNRVTMSRKNDSYQDQSMAAVNQLKGETGSLARKEGKAWRSVPEEAVAMVVPLDAQSESNKKHCLLVWFVPFKSENQPVRPPTPRSLTSNMSLRRQKSRDKSRAAVQGEHPKHVGEMANLQPTLMQPLPFRSFRIVARVVNPEDLRSGQSSKMSWNQDQEDDQPNQAEQGDAEEDESPSSPVERSVVVAVCHSRRQGVEFVLEGWDRLGFCDGCHPTNEDERNYAEWHGDGLSDQGRFIMDVVWAACVAIMGLQGL